METTARTPVRWLKDGSLRLDASFYAGPEQQKARAFVHNRTLKKRLLRELCDGGTEGIYYTGRFRRIYVDDPARGYPFLTGSGVVRADPLADCGYVSRKFTPDLGTLTLRKDTTIVTRSGSIGNTVYVNGVLNGILGSDDLVRIVPSPSQSPPGYLFAFLSSRLGKALLTQHTYGSVVQHIEAYHLFDLPVFTPSDQLEEKVDKLIQKAAKLRAEASEIFRKALARFNRDVFELSDDHRFKYPRDRFLACERVTLRNLRLDGYHNIGYCREGRDAIRAPTVLGEYITAYQPPQFKRPYVKKGVIFMSGMDLYDVHPHPSAHISRLMPSLGAYRVRAGTILVQSDGQRYGLIGRPVVLHRHLDNCAVTQHMMRVVPKRPKDSGFIYFFMLTEVGRRCLLGMSFGTSMGSLFENSFLTCACPKVDPQRRASFQESFDQVVTKRDDAIGLEREAIEMVEEEIENHLNKKNGRS